MGGTEIDPKLAPRTHAFVIQTHSGYKILKGQIDASQRIVDAKITFEQAKDNLTEVVLKLMRMMGETDMSGMEHMIRDSSQNPEIDPQYGAITGTRQIQQEPNVLSDEREINQSIEENNVNPASTTSVIIPEDGDSHSTPARITQLQEQEGTHTPNNEILQQQQQEPQPLTPNRNESTGLMTDDNSNDITSLQTIERVKPRFRQLVSDIVQLDEPTMVKQFKKEVEDFQPTMLNETRAKATAVETKRFVPPRGYVPKKLSKSQFKRLSEAFIRKDGDVREKQYRFLNLMNLIQTRFRDDNNRKLPDVAQIIHRKMCDGNLASAFRIAKREMRKERIDIMKEDIETLFPMNQNGQWEIMKYPKVARTLSDERIDTLIGRLPRDRAPGRSRITYGHIKRLNGNEKSTRQLHELIKLIYAHPDKVPPEYYTAEVTMIPKHNGGKRPIALQESIVKIIHKHIAAVITSHAMGNNDFSSSQFCIGCPEGTAEAAARIFKEMEKKETCFIASLDLSNAFNTIDQQSIITGLESLNVPGEVIEYVYNYLRTYNIHYVCNGYEHTRRTHRGVPQGCPAAMALFSVGLYRTLKDIIEQEKIRFICYADDIVMIGKTIQDMEEAMKEVEHRLTMSQLKLNSGKTKRYTNGLTEGEYKSWRDAGWKHLGIPISPDTKFIISCLNEIKDEQLKGMEIIWGDRVSSHHEAYLLQKICIQPKAQYPLRAVMPSIPKEFLEEWDEEIERRYPKYIRQIPKEYRMQQISEGGCNSFLHQW